MCRVSVSEQTCPCVCVIMLIGSHRCTCVCVQTHSNMQETMNRCLRSCGHQYSHMHLSMCVRPGLDLHMCSCLSMCMHSQAHVHPGCEALVAWGP